MGYNSVLIVDIPDELEWSEETLEKHSPEAGFFDEPDMVDELDRKHLYEELHHQLSTLTDRERKVIYGRFFLGLKQREVGEEFNICNGRVGQIENKALRKMRHPLRADKLRLMMNHTPVNDYAKELAKREEIREEKRKQENIEWEKRNKIQREQERIAEIARIDVRRRNENEWRRHNKPEETEYYKKMKEAARQQEEFNRERQKEEQEKRTARYQANRQKLIDERETSDLHKAEEEAKQEASRQRWKKYNDYLIRQIELHGHGYSEQDIPTPPDYVTLDRDEKGEPHLRVTADRYFTVPDKIYKYWLQYLLQCEGKNEKPS